MLPLNGSLLIMFNALWWCSRRWWQWIKPEPPTWRQCLVFVPIALIIFYGGMVFFEHSAKEKLLEQQGELAVRQGEREEQDKKFALEREEQQMKLAQEQKELLDKAFATPTPGPVRWSQ
jgi:uncharacterized membrane protein (DUF106 family)